MAIRHDITLSTTEPNNDIGLLKIRQADEQTQTLVVQLTATSQPKSYEGLQAFFCAKLGQSIGLGIIEQKLEQSEMTNPEAGKLEYTFRPEDWQQIGRQTGYFSFRKMKDDGHEYVEQFTTRDFYFNVTKNVFSEGLTEVKKDGSTYVWTIEDLIRLFNEYIASGKSDWEEFVDQNREVLESVDPGGLILSELIRSRKPDGAETPYPDLPTRLDEQIGKNSEFREFESEKSFMARVFNESSERGINVKWFGAKGDGQTDDTLAIQATVDYVSNQGGGVVYIPDGTYMIKAHNENTSRNIYLLDEGGVALKNNVNLKLSDLATLKAITNNQKAYQLIRLYNVENASIIGGKVEGDLAEHTGTEGEWGYGIGIHGSKNITIKDIEIFNCWGDGINLQVYQPDVADFGNVYSCQNILIDNVNSHHNRRQGMSIESAEGVEVRNSRFNDTGKTLAVLPSAGIDIEPWLHEEQSNIAKNIKITNCEFLRNKGTGVTCMNNNVSDVTIKNCVFKDNLDGEAQFKTYRCHDILVDSCEFIATENGRLSAGVRFSNGFNFVAKNCELTECYLAAMNVNSEGLDDVTFLNNRVRAGKIFKPVWIANIQTGAKRISYENNHIEYLGDLNLENNLVTFFVQGDSSRIIGNRLINLTTGIDVNGNDNYIANNEFHLTKQYAIVVRKNFKNNTILNNVLSGCCFGLNNVSAICSFGADNSIICENTIYQYSFLSFPDGTKPTAFSGSVEIQCSADFPQGKAVALNNTLVSRMDRIPVDVKLTNPDVLTTRKYILMDKGTTLISKGATAERPLVARYGDIYYDTTLNRPIFCHAGVTYNSDGSIKSNPVWINAIGEIV